MSVGCCTLPLVPMRLEPSERSEMVSQMLFGELFEVLQEKNSWSRIRNFSDDYVGWCSSQMLQLLPTNIFQELEKTSPVFTSAPLSLCACVVESLAKESSQKLSSMFLPAGSRLYFLNKETGHFSVYRSGGSPSLEHFSKEIWEMDPKPLWAAARREGENVAEAALRSALRFVNAPYLWGGKSILGMDCSGLVQLIFSIHGICLPRDARDQFLAGSAVVNLSEALPGDLAFFSNEAGNVVHVGILLNSGQIVHASGCVRMDSVDATGIFNRAIGSYTHSFFSVRRVV